MNSRWTVVPEDLVKQIKTSNKRRWGYGVEGIGWDEKERDRYLEVVEDYRIFE